MYEGKAVNTKAEREREREREINREEEKERPLSEMSATFQRKKIVKL